MNRIIALMACCGVLSGCSSALPSLDFFKSSPTTEALRIESNPPGAEAKTASGQSCRTPCELTVQPGADQSVTLTLNGYQPQTVTLSQESGDSGKLAPNPIVAELKAAAPAAAKKKKVAAKKPAKPTTTASVATQTTTASIPAPPPAAAAPEPAAPASANAYPWPTGR
jgi:hypothetical protein